MRRPLDPATELTARCFFIGFVGGFLGVLLAIFYAFGGLTSESHVVALNAAIRAVDGAEVARLLRQINSTGLPQHLEPALHPYYTLTCIPEEETTEAREVVRQVAYTFRPVPAGLDVHHHPLTAAYRHGRTTVARLLREVSAQFSSSPEVFMTEVYGSGLSIAELRQVPSEIMIICEVRDLPRCRGAVPIVRLRTVGSSALEEAHRRRYGTALAFPPRIPLHDADVPRLLVAPASTVRAGFWDDPFRMPLPNVLPPRTSPLMNPAYFSDPLNQMLYTVFGHVEGSRMLLSLLLYSVLVTVFVMAAWSVNVLFLRESLT